MTDPGRIPLPVPGDIHTPSDRRVLHSSDDVPLLRESALQHASALEKMLMEAIQDVSGARVSNIRSVKRLERIQEKIAQGKPPCTIGDFLATRIIIDDPMAYVRVLGRLRASTILEEDDFLASGKPEKGGYRAHKLQIIVAEGFSAEVQLVPREVYETSHQTHACYELMRTPGISPEDYLRAFETASRLNGDAWARYCARNGLDPET